MGANVFLINEDGQSMVETALIIALVAVIAVGGLILFGNGLDNYYNRIISQMPW